MSCFETPLDIGYLRSFTSKPQLLHQERLLHQRPDCGYLLTTGYLLNSFCRLLKFWQFPAESRESRVWVGKVVSWYPLEGDLCAGVYVWAGE